MAIIRQLVHTYQPIIHQVVVDGPQHPRDRTTTALWINEEALLMVLPVRTSSRRGGFSYSWIRTVRVVLGRWDVFRFKNSRANYYIVT